MSTQTRSDALSIRADQLALALERFGAGIEVLSLDCFDTIMWRSLYAPVDLFCELPQVSFRQRLFAEDRARARRKVARAGAEVRLADVYKQAAPHASESVQRTMCQDEIAAEKQRLFPFTPALELIQAAHRAGLKIIVVSDTYLSRAELRDLLQHVIGEQTASMISEIFVSCDVGVSKSGGLFESVLKSLSISAGKILHIGDNYEADREGAHRFGIRAVHLQQFDAQLDEQLRLEAVAGGFFDPKLRVSRATRQVHRAQLAVASSGLSSDAARLGYNVIGPIIDGFARWVDAHIGALQGAGHKVRPVFLLRDGHLPEQGFQKISSHPACRAELSRFAGFASSFVDESSIVDYLQEFAPTRRFDAVAQQLLLTPQEAQAAIATTRGSNQPVTAFTRHILQAELQARIIERSTQFASRMAAHIQAQSGCEPGDTVLLVDLGYAGTVQDRVSQVLQRLLGVKVLGAYLVLRDMPQWQLDKAAMIGPAQYDHRVMDALAAYIALLEQVCTVEQASVVNYQPDGEPIRKASDLKANQSSVRSEIQSACMNYIVERQSILREAPNQPADLPGTTQTAFASLARLMFLPSRHELALIEGFEHDVNLGVNDTVRMFDSEAARKGLLERGLFYTNDNPRQYLPAEIRSQGFATSLLLMSQRRHGFDLRAADFGHFAADVPVLLANAKTATRGTAQATPTHDGYWRLSVPIGRNELAVGIHFGAMAQVIELHSVHIAPSSRFMAQGEQERQVNARNRVVFDAVTELAPDLLRFESAESFMFVAPGEPATSEQLLHIVFRPIGAAIAASQAPTAVAAQPAEEIAQ